MATRKARKDAFAIIGSLGAKVDRIEKELMPNGGIGSLGPKVDRIEKELTPNGGSSMKDTMNRVDRTINYLQAKSRHHDDTSKDARFELDERGHLIYANSAFCELVNADEKDLLHREWVARVINSQKFDLQKELENAITNNMSFEIQVDFKTGIQKMQAVVLNLTPRVVTGGELRGFFGQAKAAEPGLVNNERYAS